MVWALKMHKSPLHILTKHGITLKVFPRAPIKIYFLEDYEFLTFSIFFFDFSIEAKVIYAKNISKS